MSQSTSPSTLAFLPLTQTKKFPYKVHDMLQHAERNHVEDIVSWMPGGKAFCVHKPELFCKKILKVFFNHSSYKSFEKQLKNWSFQFDQSEAGTIYHNPNFVRGRKSLCMKMSSKSRKYKAINLLKNSDPMTAVEDSKVDKGEPEFKIESNSSSEVVTQALSAFLSRTREESMFAKQKELETSQTLATMSATHDASLRAMLLAETNDTKFKSQTLLNISDKAAIVSTAGQRRHWEMTSNPTSNLLTTTGLWNKALIADHSGGLVRQLVRQPDSGITSCLRRSKRGGMSSSGTYGTQQDNQVEMLNEHQGTFHLDGKIATRLESLFCQSPSSPTHLFNGVGSMLSNCYGAESNRLSAATVSDLPQASALIRMMAAAEEGKKKQIIAEHLKRNSLDSNTSYYNMLNVVDYGVGQFRSASLDTHKAQNMTSKITLDLEENIERSLLERLQIEREKKLQVLLAESERNSALLLEQQKAALLAKIERDQTLGALLALSSQRPPFL